MGRSAGGGEVAVGGEGADGPGVAGGQSLALGGRCASRPAPLRSSARRAMLGVGVARGRRCVFAGERTSLDTFAPVIGLVVAFTPARWFMAGSVDPGLDELLGFLVVDAAELPSVDEVA